MQISNWSQLVDVLLTRKTAFVGVFFAVFTATYAFLAIMDWLPELVLTPPVPQEEALAPVASTSILTVTQNEPVAAPVLEEVFVPDYPLVITIPNLEKTISVLNPSSRAVADLDAALLEGVVRHPDSAVLNQDGTVFILGHSSYLPAVRNKNFQAFNGIQNLKWGDEIVVESANVTYTYRVEKVYRAQASDLTVPIAGPTKRLILATCNSFGSVDDRYIVEADLIKSE